MATKIARSAIMPAASFHRSLSSATLRANSFAELPRRWYRATWCLVLFLHGFCLGFFGIIAWLYKTLPASYLETCLKYYDIAVVTSHTGILASVHGIIAALHGLGLLLMVVWSVRKRRLSLGPQQEHSLVELVRRFASLNKKLGKQPSLARSLRLAVGQTYMVLFGRHGVFGVEGQYFDIVLLVREIVESTLQTQQAYQMSYLIPRVALNRFCILLLVSNYWSTALVSVLPIGSFMVKRMLLLLCDLVLDFVSSVGVPSVLLLSYQSAYNMEQHGFDPESWTDDIWFVNAVNEFPMILIGSWGNLAFRVIISLSFLSCLESMKRIVREAKPPPPPAPTQIIRKSQIVAASPLATTSSPRTSSMPRVTQKRTCHRNFISVAHGVFVVCGCVVLCLHLLAEIQPTLSDCAMQVRPWMTSEPACKLVFVDCYSDGISGQVDHLRGAFGEPDPVFVSHILMRHCPQLEMSPLLQRFPNLGTLKIYNSTIIRWGSDAALTDTHHPLLQSLYLIRVNTTDGHLPVGITDADTPQRWMDVELVKTNIYELPDDLDTKWLSGGTLMLEASQFSTFPSVMARLRPKELWLAGNLLTEFPFEAFAITGLTYMSVSGNPITSLNPKPYRPVTSNGTTLKAIDIGYTSISHVPKWLDPFLKKTRVPGRGPFGLRAWNTPLCERWKAMDAEEETYFLDDGEKSLEDSYLMGMTSESNKTEILQVLNCKTRTMLFYDLDHEDTISAILRV